MSLDKTGRMSLLGEVDGHLESRIVLVAVGGTALTLLDAKPSTVDVDFTGPAGDIAEFSRAERAVPHGFRIDKYKDGQVFSQLLPDDYIAKSIPIKTKLKKLELRALHPADIVATKIGRLNARDIEDIEACVKKFKLTRSQVKKRAGLVQYAGNEDVYNANLEYVLKSLFKR